MVVVGFYETSVATNQRSQPEYKEIFSDVPLSYFRLRVLPYVSTNEYLELRELST